MDFLLTFFQNAVHFVLYYFIPFIVVLGIMIFFHELGHFLVAKFFDVKVLKFALGFGPKIVAKEWGETEYSIRYIPLGGFVKMLGENEDIEEDEALPEEDIPRAFNNKHPLKRMAIAAAGPFFNVLLAFLLYWGVFYSSGAFILSTEIGYVLPDSPASKAGLNPGDIIKSVDGKTIEDLSEIQEVLLGKAGTPLEVLIERGHELIIVTVIPQEFKQEVYGREIPMADIGIEPPMDARIDDVDPESPASRAGLLQGDIIRSVDGKAIKDFREIKDALIGKADTPLEVIVERDNELVPVTVVPEASKQKMDGQEFPVATLGIRHFEFQEKREYGIWGAGIRAAVETWTWVVRIYDTIVKLLTGTYSIKMMGGPIMIGQMTGDVAQAGLVALMVFMAMISVNLGIINLFPIPILDGGLIILLLVELVIGKPLSMKTREWAQKIGLFLIAILMAVVIYNDIGGVVNQIP
jgi:regulator of sigma E protease